MELCIIQIKIEHYMSNSFRNYIWLRTHCTCVDIFLIFLSFVTTEKRTDLRFWTYLMKVIPETRRTLQIIYLRFYYYHWVVTSAGGLLDPNGIIRPVVSASVY